MQRISALTMGALMFALVGCNKAKSPDAVASDVATAQQQAAAKLTDARDDAAKDTDKAAAKVDEKTQALNNVDANGTYDVAMAKADGDHKVATEQCTALSGDRQTACKDQADARYELAKANAKATLAAQKQ